MKQTERKTTHFGFRDVPEEAKAGMVHGVFTSVASKYDIMNDVMSVGVHRLWKDAMMDWLAPRNGQRLLDVAGGTGDIAFRFLGRAPQASAVVLDMTESMLAEGRKRAEAEKLSSHLDWTVGDAMALLSTCQLQRRVSRLGAHQLCRFLVDTDIRFRHAGRVLR